MAGTFSEYSPAASSSPYGICQGPDGNLWAVLRGTGKVAKVTPAGSITEYLVNASAGLYNICAGPDGNLWITDWGRDKIVKMTTSGSTTEYATTTGAGAFGICSDGTNLWFTEYLLNKVSKITTSGTITRYSPTSASSNPTGIVLGPDGNLWFCEGATNKIGVINTAGTMQAEYATAGTPYNICSDGTNLWFVQQTGNKVTKMTTGGSTTDYTLTASADPRYIVYVPADGAVFFSEYGLGKIGRITTGGTYTELTPTTGSSHPLGICLGPEGDVWFSENTGNKIAKVTVAGYARSSSDAWAWSGTAVPSVPGVRSAADAWAWSEAITTSRKNAAAADTWAISGSAGPAIPAARTARGAPVRIWASGDAGYNYYAFASFEQMANGRFIAICRRGATHTTWDGDIVAKFSSDGVSWDASSTVLVDHTVNGYDNRDTSITRVKSGPYAGRLCMTWGMRKQVAGITQGFTPFMYSDDNGATWSSVIDVAPSMYQGTDGVHSGAAYGSDVVPLPNGDLLLVGYGYINATDTVTSIFVSKSTDGGATWSHLAYAALPANYGGYSCVEPQVEVDSSGRLLMTFHTEDGLPTNWYRVRSLDSGATWQAGALVDSNTGNRQGLTIFADDRVIVGSAVRNAGSGQYDLRYYESYDGSNWSASRDVDADPVGTDPGRTYGIWIMAQALAGSGAGQNVAFIYGAQSSNQGLGDVFFQWFTGIDGTVAWPRQTSDAWAWSEAITKLLSKVRGTSDAWAWSEAIHTSRQNAAASDAWAMSGSASGSVNTHSSYSRSAPNAWGWSEIATATVSHVIGYTRGANDAWAWPDAARRLGYVRPFTAPLHVSSSTAPLTVGSTTAPLSLEVIA